MTQANTLGGFIVPDDDSMDQSGDYTPDQSSSSSESDDESPQEVVIRTFIGHVSTFLTNRADDISAAYESNAGWEGWLHVELYNYVRAQHTLSIAREPHAYAHHHALRADFAIAQLTGAASVPVEIKCETKRESEHNFKARSNADAVKVNAINGWALVFAIVVSQDSHDVMATDSVAQFTDNQGDNFWLMYTSSEPA